MNPRLRYTLFAGAASMVAVVAGWQIAGGELVSLDIAGLVVLAAALLSIGAILIKLLRLPLDVIFLGGVLAGYVVANRGFAQLTPASSLPLFPAELALMLSLSWRVIVWAHQRESPLQRDPLNFAILAWLVVGSVRLPFDVPKHGVVALRDYAMVYYALFFFVAQHMANNPRARLFLRRCLLVSLVVLPFAYALSVAFPDFFLNTLVVRGAPLIYYKGDLALTFLAIGSVVLFFSVPKRQRLWAWPLSVAMFLFVISGGNRASMLGLIVVTGLLLVARQWKYAAVQLTALVVAGLIVFGLAVSGTNRWADKKIDGVADRVRSMVDVQGTYTYQSEESFNKGDNNQFRLVWWKNVFEETLHGNPVFGLGFGHDLARGFLQEYYADSDEEFTVRSPHNIFLSVFGRMGIAGLFAWIAICGLILRGTWQSLRQGEDPGIWALWCAVWLILVSATFGVVLEGPMGALPFWTLLALAHAARSLKPGEVKTDRVESATSPRLEATDANR